MELKVGREDSCRCPRDARVQGVLGVLGHRVPRDVLLSNKGGDPLNLAPVENNLLPAQVSLKTHRKLPFHIFIMGSQVEAPVAEKEGEAVNTASENAGGFADYLVRNKRTLKDMC